MNWQRYSMLVLCSFILGALSGCLSASHKDIEIVSITTNKETYTFGTFIHVTVNLKSSKPFSNITVHLDGLKNDRNQSQIGARQILEMINGEEQVTFSEKIPTCSPCTKLSPGEHIISVIVTQNTDVLDQDNITVTVTK